MKSVEICNPVDNRTGPGFMFRDSCTWDKDNHVPQDNRRRRHISPVYPHVNPTYMNRNLLKKITIMLKSQDPSTSHMSDLSHGDILWGKNFIHGFRAPYKTIILSSFFIYY